MSWQCPSCEERNEDDSILRCTCGHELIDDELNNKNLKEGRKTGKYWLGLIISIIVGIYCMMGVAMTGSFSVAAPERKEHYLAVANLYLTGVGLCFILALAFSVFIFRASRNNK
ncbi:MAG TPA: hypothetical protein DCX54_04170 [Flavobacteriales bacterium]|nr:hypothetical protein [Flavobacteriales bacterium]